MGLAARNPREQLRGIVDDDEAQRQLLLGREETKEIGVEAVDLGRRAPENTTTGAGRTRTTNSFARAGSRMGVRASVSTRGAGLSSTNATATAAAAPAAMRTTRREGRTGALKVDIGAVPRRGNAADYSDAAVFDPGRARPPPPIAACRDGRDRR